MSTKKSSCAGSQRLLLTPHNLAANPSSFSACDNALEANCGPPSSGSDCWLLSIAPLAGRLVTAAPTGFTVSCSLVGFSGRNPPQKISPAISSYMYNTPVLSMTEGSGGRGGYLIFVTDTTDGVWVKKIARCNFLQI